MTGFDPAVPNTARVYSCLLGGMDHFPADRGEAGALLEIYPPIAGMVREKRAFITRAVQWAAVQGIGQFTDLGAGLEPVVYQAAREVLPGHGSPASTLIRWSCPMLVRCSPDRGLLSLRRT